MALKASTLLQLVREDMRIRAAWLEEGGEEAADRAELHVAVDEAHVAAFYAARHDWLAPLSPVYVRDIRRPWPGCLALTAEGLLILAIETWGSVPERPRRHVRVLLDRTGRLEERLQPWRPPERVDFAMLDRLAADVWFNLWAARALRERDLAGYLGAVAAAARAYLTFVTACHGRDVESMAWSGELAGASGLEEDTFSLPVEAVAERVAHLMSTRGRALGEARGWTYPQALEALVRGAQAGDGTGR